MRDRRGAAYRAAVWRMRARGERLPVDQVLGSGAVEGWLLCEQHGGQWGAALYKNDLRSNLLVLAEVRLVRQNGGVRLYQGLEWEREIRQWPQTWLCAPTVDVGAQILRRMQQDPV
jgi:hypothetical protein